MSRAIAPELVDRMIELYCDWRAVCEEVRTAYERFVDASAADRSGAFAAYNAALDREESAGDSYAVIVRDIQSRLAAAADGAGSATHAFADLD